MGGVNLASWLDRAGLAFAARPALALGERVIADYATLAARAAGLARGLRESLGLAPGARVAILSANCPAYVEVLYAAWHAGLAMVPINAKLHPAEVAYILEHSGAEALFVSGALAGTLGGHLPEPLRHVVRIGDAEYERLASHDPMAMAAVGPDALAWLFYTSGTTGRPKGAMLTHRNLVTMSLAYHTDVDPTGPLDTILHAAPMSHGSGIYILPHVAAGALNAVPESGGFEAAEIFSLTRHWTRTSMFAAPTMVKRLVDHPGDADPSGIRTLVYGGGPMYVADARAALDRLGACLAQIYGQGESPMTITVLRKDQIADAAHPRWLERLGSVGMANAAVEVRVAEDGEVLVKGDVVMAGYWKNPEASAEALRGGWLHTGDIGTMDADGFLTLKDRSKDVIISGGSNVYPREVEEVLLTHPAVAEVSVIGRPDPEWGEVVIAYVVGTAPEKDLDALCLSAIARFKRPKAYVYVNALPKNNYGKVLKTELRAADQRARAAATSDLTSA